MIISHGRNYIFVHIPKTGGTALTLALEGRAMKDDILIGDTPKAVKRRKRIKGLRSSGKLWKHSRLTDIYGLVTQEEIEQFFVFTIVRNPWDRMVSYYHWLKEQTFEHSAVALAKTLNFSDFLNERHTQISLQATPYGHYVTDKSGVEQCDLYIRLEHLAADLAPFEQHLGFSLGTVEKTNVSARDADYRGYYSDQDAQIIERICAADIERFGYQFSCD